ncbi:MAG: hypothetical protein CMI02_07035 [Oceanospirillaceae bacterium]|nr:hypothetical protein [Oceanospirillaceae bacterium]MBT11771.1 hypothetical protein [Oceanospirillaceae bacterium]|tara:strand:- start:58810 stop:59169 length:360 start_codon:yes stop_codon:yes gene_type:complete
MFTLTHEGDVIGTSQLESGDPTAMSVSGLFNNVGGADTLAAWMRSIGAKEEDNITFITLDEPFQLQDAYGTVINFKEGSLIAIPDDEEVFLEVEGLSPMDYQTHFRSHILAFHKSEQES